MKRFSLALLFCASLLAGLAIYLFPTTSAAENPLLTLLNLPAPPPPNPQVVRRASERGADFYSKNKPPSDDAPIHVLMDYWRMQSQSYNDLGYKIYPSARVLSRLMDEIAKEPAQLGDFLNIFPRTDESARFVKQIFEKPSQENEGERDRRSGVRRWLKYNTPYYSSELAREAARVEDIDDYVSNHRELIALARVDWNAAEPIVNRLYNNPGQKASRTAALWALYVHALESAVSDVDRYRDELKDVVADKTLSPGVRDLALDALSLEKEWSGRDEWYISMMEDETLTDLGRFTGLTTLPGSSPEGKYVDRMIGLLDSDNIAVRSAAAQNLLDKIDWNREAIVNALVRWLSNPKWLRETGRGGRTALIRALAQVKAPDSVPGLIAALDEKGRDSAIPMYRSSANAVTNAAWAAAYAAEMAGRAANSANAAANVAAMPAGGYYPLRQSAVTALAFQKDPRAVNALKRILNEGGAPYEKGIYIEAIYECGGFTVAEQVAAVEKWAKASPPLEEDQVDDVVVANRTIKGRISGDLYTGVATDGVSPLDKNGIPITDTPFLLGVMLVARPAVDDGLARGVIDRIAATEKSDPVLSNSLRKIILRWKGTAVNAMLLHDLKRNRVDVDAIVRLLADRKELREKQMADISDLRNGSATAVGISACLFEDPGDQEGILASAGDETKTALLACARLIRSALPVQKVAENLQSKDKLLALAAERYLETEESAEARQIVLSLHPNEAKILGASTAFFVEPNPGSTAEQLGNLFASVDPFHNLRSEYDQTIARDPEFVETEKRLQEEVKKETTLLGVYNWRENFIRIYKDRVVLSWEKDPARYQERALTDEEFSGFKGLLAHYKADELPPFLEDACATDECSSAQLLMLGRNGGRRLYVAAESMPPLFAELDRMFQDFRLPPSTVRYWAARDVPGLEVLFADERLEALTVWKNGGDFRLLTSDKIRQAALENELESFAEKLIEEDDSDTVRYGMDPRLLAEMTRRRHESYSWNDFSTGKLGAAVAQPEQAEYLPVQDGQAVARDRSSWKARAGSIEIRSNEKELYKVTAGKAVKIASGFFSGPVITPDGRWLVMTRYGPDSGPQLVRINLHTNKQFVVQSADIPLNRAVAYVSSVNRILVGPWENQDGGYGDEEAEPSVAEEEAGYYFLDPETGSLLPTRGEIRPLLQQTFRGLQPTSNPFDFWVAIPGANETSIGVYNSRVFTVRPLLKIPRIKFDSMDMWVDEPGGKIYFVYEGHLLAVPVKSKNGG